MAKNAGLTLTEEDVSTIVSGPGQTIGAVVIRSKKGPLNSRFLATSTKRFREKYGDEEPGYYGHYTALAALQEGPVYILRTADADDNPLYGGALFQDEAATALNAALSTGVSDPATYTFTGGEVLLITADNPGLWGNSVKVILTQSATDTEVFTIDVYYPDADGNYTLVESWDVSRVILKKDGYGKSMYVEDVINDNSDYIRVKDNTAIAGTVLPKEQGRRLLSRGGREQAERDLWDQAGLRCAPRPGEHDQLRDGDHEPERAEPDGSELLRDVLPVGQGYGRDEQQAP
jgi:hypothetical protein